jgi:hypothetical protein
MSKREILTRVSYICTVYAEYGSIMHILSRICLCAKETPMRSLEEPTHLPLKGKISPWVFTLLAPAFVGLFLNLKSGYDEWALWYGISTGFLSVFFALGAFVLFQRRVWGYYRYYSAVVLLGWAISMIAGSIASGHAGAASLGACATIALTVFGLREHVRPPA